MKVRVPIIGTVGKSVAFDPNAGARAEAAVAALAAQISAGLGGSIQHRSLQGLQVGDDHPQYTMWQAPETIVALWNFQQEPDIEGVTLTEFIEDVVGGSFVDFLQDTTSVVWTYFDTAGHLEANVPPEFVQDTVGAMLTDSTSIDFTYNDPAGTFTATIIDEYVQDLVGAMLVDTSTVDFTYDDAGGTFSAVVPGAALTKVDDTNVTLTLGGSPTTALARAASLTLGWTGTLAVARGGTGNGALAALTKTDDTNVTLTLGGSPATALVNAASLTLGWTGQLAVARGGSGAATLTGYLKGNGTSAFTASSAIPYSDISGTPSIPSGANPTASVGLAAVNGSAATFMRSDGAPALSQSIVPTWTGNHTFTPASGSTKVHAGNLYFDVDNLELQLGAGSGSAGDLRLFHDGTNSFIRNDTGELRVSMAGTVTARFQPTGLRVDGGASDSCLAAVGTAGATARSLLAMVHLGVANGFTCDSDGAGLMIYKMQNMGTTASAANLFVDNANSNNFLRSTSSLRYKTNIRSLVGGDLIERLRPVLYNSTCAADDSQRDHFGLIAEEVAEVHSALVAFNAGGLPESVQYERVVVPLIAYVQKLSVRIKELENGRNQG